VHVILTFATAESAPPNAYVDDVGAAHSAGCPDTLTEPEPRGTLGTLNAPPAPVITAGNGVPDVGDTVTLNPVSPPPKLLVTTPLTTPVVGPMGCDALLHAAMRPAPRNSSRCVRMGRTT
jgi:hypothetical protein